MQAQQKRCPVGTRTASLSPLQQSRQSSQHWRLKLQPRAWASPEQGQGEQEAAGGLRELGYLGRHLLNLYHGANLGF